MIVIPREKPLLLDQKKEHLALVEEHLRRAIIEPYEKCVDQEVTKINEQLYPQYIREVAPRERELKLDPVMSEGVINEKLSEVAKLVTVGRKLKTRNIWDDNWEEAVKIFIQAFELVRPLRELLERVISIGEYGKNFETTEEQKRVIAELTHGLSRKLLIGTLIGVSATLLATILGVIITLLVK